MSREVIQGLGVLGNIKLYVSEGGPSIADPAGEYSGAIGIKDGAGKPVVIQFDTFGEVAEITLGEEILWHSKLQTSHRS